MGLTDPHDRRTFTHYLKLNADGTVAALVERADVSLTSTPDDDGSCYVDITEFRKAKSVVNLYTLTLDAKAVQAAMAEPVKDRSSLLTELNAAMAAALPDALADAVFGKVP